MVPDKGFDPESLGGQQNYALSQRGVCRGRSFCAPGVPRIRSELCPELRQPAPIETRPESFVPPVRLSSSFLSIMQGVTPGTSRRLSLLRAHDTGIHPMASLDGTCFIMGVLRKSPSRTKLCPPSRPTKLAARNGLPRGRERAWSSTSVRSRKGFLA